MWYLLKKFIENSMYRRQLTTKGAPISLLFNDQPLFTYTYPLISDDSDSSSDFINWH